MNNSNTNTILNDDAVAEITERDWHLNGALEKRIALSPAERDGLVTMVRMFNQHYENLMRAALLREQKAAISMRSRCVEKVRLMRDEWRDKHANAGTLETWRHFGTLFNGADEIITALESVSIQEQEINDRR